MVIQLPNQKQILIEIDQTIDIKYLNEYFIKKQVYFHENCFKLIKFKMCGIEIPQKYVFSSIPNGSIVYVETNQKLVNIEYHDYQFFFVENDRVTIADTYIRSIFPCPKKTTFILEIQDANNNKSISLADNLKSCMQYIVYAKKMFLLNIVNGSFRPHFIDYLSTVSETKSLLASIYSDKIELYPEDIIIFDQNKKIVSDPNKKLISIESKTNKIYFDIKKDTEQQNFSPNKNHDIIKKKNPEDNYKNTQRQTWNINFIFEDNSKLNFQKRLETDTKIKEITKMIVSKYNIQGKIEIQYYGNRTKINDDTSIYGIRDKIRHNSKNFLYVKIYTQTREEDKRTKQKSSKAEENDDDIDMPRDNPTSNKIKEKDRKRLTKSKPSISEIDYNNEEEEQLNKIKPKPNSMKNDVINSPTFWSSPKQKLKIAKEIQKFKSNSKPTKTEINNDSDDDSNYNPKSKIVPPETKNQIIVEEDKRKVDDQFESNKSKYTFQYERSEKHLRLKNDSHLKDNEERIKVLFHIYEQLTLDYFAISKNENNENDDNDDDNDYQEINAKNIVMQSLKEKTILIKIHKQLKPKLKEKNDSNKIKYYYQINSNSKINEIELDSSAKVITLKKIIAEQNDVDDLANVKVLFAGKDLLNDLVLESLNIGSKVLYIYIRSMEDILLMTAKALRV